MNPSQLLNNVPRNVIILAIAVTAVLGIFHLIPLVILVWIVALSYIIIYQYRSSKSGGSNFVCLECATIHQQNSCPKCGSKLKKFYSRTSSYGV
ncbi:MAG: hypothetical protein KGH89_04040 [Thaumarchaeota archaeon]|nr:hypothetical protein [Nitrososphaerota archaeon]MDE1867378.1 hypothetical protein [Nitrososphaerota archaeon]